MKTIVVYNSKRGSTKQYAEWIAEDIREFSECDLISLADANGCNFYDYDLVIYGGWIRGSGIVDFDKFSKMWEEDLLDRMMVFGVGVALPTPENYMQVWSLNLGKLDPKNEHKATLYILDGKYDPATVTGFDKMLMGIAKKVMLSGATRDAKDAAGEMRRRIEDGVDLVKRENISALVKEAAKRLGV